jgi:hypothetical protein
LQPPLSSSLALTFQAHSFSSRFFHQAKHGANSSNWMGAEKLGDATKPMLALLPMQSAER